MKAEHRNKLRLQVVGLLKRHDMFPLTVGAHEITRQLVYAGCSQWFVDGREWDTSRHGWALIVDDQYWLTSPELGYFDGHNQIYKQTGLYLQGNRCETPPSGPTGEPLEPVPDKILLEIAAVIAEAIEKFTADQAAEDAAAEAVIEKLSV